MNFHGIDIATMHIIFNQDNTGTLADKDLSHSREPAVVWMSWVCAPLFCEPPARLLQQLGGMKDPPRLLVLHIAHPLSWANAGDQSWFEF